MSNLNSSLPAWGAVAAHARDMDKVHLRDLAGADPKRWQNFHVEHDTWLLDISRQRITHQSLALLLDLARAVDLSDRIAAMFRGDPINSTEKRAVLHTALRSDFAGSPAIQSEVKASRQKLKNFVAAVRSGTKLGVTGKKFRHVVISALAARTWGRCWCAMRCVRNGAATSRRTSCPMSTARSSRI